MTVEERRKQIVEGNMLKIVIILAIPVVINGLISAFYTFFDVYFMSMLGANELSSVSFVGPITMVVASIGNGISIAGTTLIAREIGKENYENAKKYIGHVIAILLAVSIVVAAYSVINAEAILYKAGATDQIIELATIYLKSILISTPLTYLGVAFLAIKRAEGNNKRAMYVSILQVVVKITLNYVFIIKLNMGVVGLGYATILSRLVLGVAGVYSIFIEDTTIRINLRDIKINRKMVMTIVLMALPIVIEKSTQSFGHVIVNNFAIGFSEEVLTGYQITNRINSIAFTATTGVGIAIATIVSQNLALNNQDRVNKAIKYGFGLGVAMSIFLLFGLFAFKDFLLTALCAGDVNIYNYASDAMKIYSMSIIPWSIIQVSSGVFQGAGKTQYPMYISLLRLWVFRILVIYLLIKLTNLNEFSIWYGMLIGNTLAAITSVVMLKYWRRTSQIG